MMNMMILKKVVPVNSDSSLTNEITLQKKQAKKSCNSVEFGSLIFPHETEKIMPFSILC